MTWQLITRWTARPKTYVGSMPRPLLLGCAVGLACSLIGAPVYITQAHHQTEVQHQQTAIAKAALPQAQQTNLSIADALKTSGEGRASDSVSNIETTGTYARGDVRDRYGVTNRFIAAYNGVKWVVVYRGTSQPEASVCTQEQIPATWCASQAATPAPSGLK